MKPRSRFRYRLVALPLSFLLTYGPVLGMAAEEDPEWPAGSLIEQFRFSETAQDFTTDVLVPVWYTGRTVVFINPRATFTESREQEMNIGAGLRHLFGENGFILGGNLYYDSRYTEFDNQFDQLGVGAEFLSSWVDARFNWYYPEQDREKIGEEEEVTVSSSTSTSYGDLYAEDHAIKQKVTTRTTVTTTTRVFEFFEEPLGGFDAEVGARLPCLPDWLETRAFLGYFDFETPFSGEDLEGVKARLEVRTASPVTLDAEWFDADAFGGSDFYVGGRIQLPFEIGNLLTGKNPFEGTRDAFRPAQRPLRHRMLEMVIRDPRIKMEESGPIENAGMKQVENKTKKNSSSQTVLGDVNFVDDDATPGGDGSAEAPYQDIQSGVNNAFGKANVYVYEGNYNQNVVVNTTVRLYGAGKKVAGAGGKTFGSGIAPVLDATVGGVDAPGMRIQAHDVLVQGFDIVRTGGTDAPGNDVIFNKYPVADIGILAENADNLSLICNTVNGHSHGAVIVADAKSAAGGGGVLDYNVALLDNDMNGGTIGGALIDARGGSGSFSATIEDNAFDNTGGHGLDIRVERFDALYAAINRNSMSMNVSNGVYMIAPTNIGGPVTLFLNENVADDNGLGGNGDGILVGLPDIAGDFFLRMNDNAPDRNQGLGQVIFVGDVGGNADVQANRNQASHNRDTGLGVSLGNVGGHAWMEMSGNTGDTNGHPGGGSGLVMGAGAVGGNFYGRVADNKASSNENIGIGFAALSVGGDAFIEVTDNVVQRSGDFGIYALVLSNVQGNAFMDISRNTVNENGQIIDGRGILGQLGTIGGDLEFRVTDNEVQRNEGSGIIAYSQRVSGDSTFIVTGNTVVDNASTTADGMGIGFGSLGVDGNYVSRFSDNITDRNATWGAWFVGLDTGGNLDLRMNNNQADGNKGSGLSVLHHAVSGNVTASIRNNRTVSNEQYGIAYVASNVIGGDVSLEISGNVADYNGSFPVTVGDGISAQFFSNVVGNLSVRIADNAPDRNIDNGIHLRHAGVGGDLLVELLNNRANDNRRDGIQYYAYGDIVGNAILRIRDNTVHGNGGSRPGDGIDVSLYGSRVLSNLSAVFAGNMASSNDIDGVDFNHGFVGGNAMVVFSNNVASYGARGIRYSATSNIVGNASLQIIRNTADHNRRRSYNGGVLADYQGPIQGDLDVWVLDNIAIANDDKGIDLLHQQVAGNADIAIHGNRAVSNDLDGIRYAATGVVSGVANASGEWNVLRHNGRDGLRLDLLAMGSPTIDFGGGALGSAGQNSIFGNTDFGVMNIGGTPISLESNYWGGAAPTQNAVPPADLNPGATAPATWLAADPNP